MLNPIKDARRTQGVSQQELAKRMGVHRQSVADWEIGRYLPSGKNLTRLCSELDISPMELIEWTQNRKLSTEKNGEEAVNSEG